MTIHPEVDYYDVEQMIRAAREDMRRELRDEICTLERSIEQLREALTSVDRTLNARTEHLV